MSEVVEIMARAIAEGQGDDFDLAHRDKPHWNATRGESGGRYRDINEPRQPDYLDAARSAITALEANGWAIVPCEPSEEMCEAGWEVPDSITDSYRAMISIGKAKG